MLELISAMGYQTEEDEEEFRRLMATRDEIAEGLEGLRRLVLAPPDGAHDADPKRAKVRKISTRSLQPATHGVDASRTPPEST
jgi:hypothetical protein